MATSEADLAKVGVIWLRLVWLRYLKHIGCCRQVAQEAVKAAQRRKELVGKIVQTKAVPKGKAAAVQAAPAEKKEPGTPARPAPNKRMHETLTPLTAEKKTPSTKTSDPKNLKTDEADGSTRKDLFGD